MAFEECYDFIEETTEKITEETTQETTRVSTEEKKLNWIHIMVFVIITVVVIAVIITVIIVLKRRKDKPKNKGKHKPKTTTQSGISSLPQRPKGSITENIDRFHNQFIDSKTETTVSTKTSTVKEDKANLKASVKPSDIKRRVSPPKKTSVKSPKRTFAKTNLI